jgi:hypothetical protein
MKFSIRELLLLTFIVALALGWWLDSTTKAAKTSKEIEEWKNRAESSKLVIERASGYSLEWKEPVPQPDPKRHVSPLQPVKDSTPDRSASISAVLGK